MSGYYTITAARNAGERPNPHGGTLVKWYCTFVNERGDSLEDVYWQRKQGNDVTPGDKVYGTVSQGDYGPRFKLEPKPDGDQPSSSGPQAGEINAGVPPTPGRDPKAADGAGTSYDDRSRRIERQHSQEMALRLLTLDGAKFSSPDEIKQVVTGWTDWFQRDLELPKGNGGAAGQSVQEKPAPPAPSKSEVAAMGLEYDDEPGF